MTRRSLTDPVALGFEKDTIELPIGVINLLRPIADSVRRTRKFTQIAVSIREIGLVEPLVVSRDRSLEGRYLLLDGHLRLEILKDLGRASVPCLISTDDEAFTYNKRISRLAIIQEHKMILKALERGISEERLAAVLDVDVNEIRRKRRLLDGICPEAARMLEDKHLSARAFLHLRQMLPLRQIEAAELMVAMNTFTTSYAASLLAATPPGYLVQGRKPRQRKGLSDEQAALMQRESASLDRELRLVEATYAQDHLDLVLAKGFIGKLLSNSMIERFLTVHHPELLTELARASPTSE